MTNTCHSCRQAHKKCLFVFWPFRPRGQRGSRPCKDSFVVNNDEAISKRKWTPGPQTGRQERFWTISPVPSSIDLSTPLLGHHPMVTSLLHRSEVIFRPMKDGDGKRTFELGPIVTNGIQMPKTKPTESPPTRLSQPSQTKEPPIPGPSPSSKPPEVAPTQSTEEPSARPATPRSILIIDNTPIRFLVPSPVQSPFHSHNDACQEFTDFDDSSSHWPQIDQPNLVGALPLAPHYSVCKCTGRN
ncbi:hypothetical protein O181_094001 [Austropuccinia psidii MF-1]|uniref:Uncharacterized protein n=1 Tax=Austropuccinia psidii MF-1 TaxID=1389203 RepID=A0A9Q3PC05_9BASI|nr:hypothetical protein [Austropuccinia psidii MF-1]